MATLYLYFLVLEFQACATITNSRSDEEENKIPEPELYGQFNQTGTQTKSEQEFKRLRGVCELKP